MQDLPLISIIAKPSRAVRDASAVASCRVSGTMQAKVRSSPVIIMIMLKKKKKCRRNGTWYYSPTSSTSDKPDASEMLATLSPASTRDRSSRTAGCTGMPETTKKKE